MSKTSIIPPGTGNPIAPFVPGSLADNVLYVSGTLPFDKDNNVVHVGDAIISVRVFVATFVAVVGRQRYVGVININ